MSGCWPRQRRWTAAFADTGLQLIHSNSPTAGLTDGTTDLAILRRPPEAAAVEHVRIGAEKHYCVMSSEDPQAVGDARADCPAAGGDGSPYGQYHP
ncbi:LysR substrate-binding domain-containing protein [Arthrobacter sp. efr-133-TYG-118]|uniref:LysR substrate-binding domain-containing protein n=1 Tax=Arthrobacter sp. efr-133-TYG-118 TaxID=3040279 RepID=UPI002550B56B|nr:LysR substrate-binding domain-containing protein [Arthrobacter sp. efr-133-TYG-118]